MGVGRERVRGVERKYVGNESIQHDDRKGEKRVSYDYIAKNRYIEENCVR